MHDPSDKLGAMEVKTMPSHCCRVPASSVPLPPSRNLYSTRMRLGLGTPPQYQETTRRKPNRFLVIIDWTRSTGVKYQAAQPLCAGGWVILHNMPDLHSHLGNLGITSLKHGTSCARNDRDALASIVVGW